MIDQPALVALGSNLGDRAGHLMFALDRLRHTAGITVVGPVSRFHETAAVGPGDQPAYLNAAVCLQTTLAPRDLLRALLSIERERGRVRDVRWGPRTLDLDLLLFDDLVVQSEDLTLPHPRMQDRTFVLAPVVEIAPEWRHPVLNATMRELLEQLETRRQGEPGR